MSEQHHQDRFFPYKMDKRWAPTFIALRVTKTDGVSLTTDGLLRATFGRFLVETPVSNIDHTHITGPHRWYTAVGLRLSATDDGITFGTNHRSGLSIVFKERIPRVIGLRKHSTLWVSVAEPERLAEAIGV
jgi:hypothetical protein